MNKIWIGTNWKMTKTLAEGTSYTKELIKISKNLSSNIELFIIPSHTALVPIKELTKKSRIHIGAQNMHWEDEGPYTGEISPMMLDEIGINIIELGHSERRQYFNENDYAINKKIFAAFKYGLKPLICIGENLTQKNNNISKETLESQLKVCLKDLTKEQARYVMIAYEPVWAIGDKGIPADTSYVAEVHEFLRKKLYELYDSAGLDVPLLYGGNVNQDNFLEYSKLKNVNGLFIGRAAWDMDNFKEILQNLDSDLYAQ